MNGSGQVLLGDADATLVLDLQHGGAVREYRWRGHPVLRPAVSGSVSDPFQLASFPLVPYVNRIAGGRFEAGTAVTLAPNWSADPHPLHGKGWRSPWVLEDSTGSAAILRFEGGGDEWPWRYRARQRFELKPDGLSLRLSVENLSDSPMPAALGLHPYFPRAADAHLTTRTTRVWMTDPAALPVAEVPVPRDWSFDAGRAVAAVPLDHCFTGWSGGARLRWPGFSVTLQASGCGFLHVYVPQGGDFFCLEPQTVATGAFNRAPGEVPRVAPGAELALTLDLLLTET